MNSKELSFVMAKRLKEERKKKGLSHVALSAELKKKYNISISKDSLLNYEIDSEHRSNAFSNNGMKIEYLRCLADFYGVSTDYLLGLSDISSRNEFAQSMHKTLGFSESVTSYLSVLNVADPVKTEIINSLVEHPEFDSLVNHIEMAIELHRNKKVVEQHEWDKLREIVCRPTNDGHSDNLIAEIISKIKKVDDIDIVLSILGESAPNSVILNRQDALKFYIEEAQASLRKVIESLFKE